MLLIRKVGSFEGRKVAGRRENMGDFHFVSSVSLCCLKIDDCVSSTCVSKTRKYNGCPYTVPLAAKLDGMCVHAKSLQSCHTLCNSMDWACQAPLSMGFSRQEYWSGLLWPPPGESSRPRD